MGCSCSKERTRKLLSAESRRKHLATHPLIIERKIPSNVEIIREYVDTGKGHVIAAACFRDKNFNEINLKGMIFYCQGYSSFVDWTDTDVAIKFVEKGYIVITHDHYGHGRSDGNWLTNPTSSFNTYVDDAIYIFERAKRKYTPASFIKQNKKFGYYLLGHSLGGAISIEISKRYTSSSYYLNVEDLIKSENKNDDGDDNEIDEKSPLKNSNSLKNKLNQKNDYIPAALLGSYCNNDISINTDHQNDCLYGWDGLILSAPMVKIKDDMKPAKIIQKIGEYLSPVIPEARIVPTSKSMVDLLTRDDEYFKFVKKSPLMYDDKPALRTAIVLVKFCNHLETSLSQIKLPIYIMHGEKDEITDPTMSKLLYDKCSSKEKKIQIFDGAFHALLIDTCRNQVFDSVDQWILERNKSHKK